MYRSVGDHSHGTDSQYVYWDSKLLTPVVCFDELVETGLWAVWAEQHAVYTQFLPILSWIEESEFTNAKE